MYLGFTKNKVLFAFLLLSLIFVSLALSQVSFDRVYAEGLKTLPIPLEKCKNPSFKNIKTLPKQLTKYVKCINKKMVTYDKYIHQHNKRQNAKTSTPAPRK
jgi:hypothetical protein